jgi:hypothetical protein
MPLSEDNQKWVRDEIKSAIFPNGWSRVANRIRYWSLPAACVGGVLALVAIVINQNNSLNNRVSQESEFRGSTTVRLKTIEDRLSGIEKSLLTIRIGQASSSPISQRNIKDAKQVLESAKKDGVQLPTDVVEQSGKNFIKIASKEPAAWDVALRFAEYRSYLNTFNPSVLPPGARLPGTMYTAMVEVGYTPVAFSVVGAVPIDKAARFNKIGEALRFNTNQGNAFIIGVGGAVSIDDYELRNVVFQSVHIMYRGGPLQTKNVYFIDCTFDFPSSLNGQEIATAILSSPSINLALS